MPHGVDQAATPRDSACDGDVEGEGRGALDQGPGGLGKRVSWVLQACEQGEAAQASLDVGVGAGGEAAGGERMGVEGVVALTGAGAGGEVQLGAAGGVMVTARPSKGVAAPPPIEESLRSVGITVRPLSLVSGTQLPVTSSF